MNLVGLRGSTQHLLQQYGDSKDKTTVFSSFIPRARCPVDPGSNSQTPMDASNEIGISFFKIPEGLVERIHPKLQSVGLIYAPE